jgi:hypothetical protein
MESFSHFSALFRFWKSNIRGMKRVIFFLLLLCGTAVYGQHFQLTHATSRSWVSQSNPDQRGAEYRITLLTQKKIKNLTIARIWIQDRCYVIESLSINDKAVSSSKQSVPKGASLRIYVNVKEVRNSSGTWSLNNDECNGVTPVKPQEGKVAVEYSVNGTSGVFIIKDVEVLTPIQFN